MKKETKLPVFNQYETVSPATKLLEKRRKMYEIHEQFQAKKDQFKNQETEFKSGEDDLKTKDKDLQNKLTAFCQFLQENQSKRKKAEERFRQEEKAYAEKEDTIKSKVSHNSDLEKQIEQLKRSQKKYQIRAAYLRKYEDFLEKVRSTYSEEYPEMSDILNRYNTLKKSNDDRIRQRETMEHNHEVLKQETLAEEKRYNQDILTISNKIKELSRNIEDMIKEKNEVQAEVEQSNEDFSKKNLTLGKIFLAIDNLNYRCNQNNYKLKYEFDDKGTGEKKEVRNKKIEGESNFKNDEELSYQQKSKQASIKLKNITSHIKDFKAIIDEYKIQSKHAKLEKN